MAATLFVGLPAFTLFRRLRWLHATHFALAGASAGVIVVATVWLVFGPRHQVLVSPPFARELDILGAVGFFAAMGLVHGLAFWALGVWRNSFGGEVDAT